MSSPGTPTSVPPPNINGVVSAAPPVGLINAAPGSTTTTPGAPPTGAPAAGAPVTSYNPAQATALTAQTTPVTVTPEQTAASQLEDIIASGSPLMQQAEANAKNQMNARGLINSSIGIGAGQSAVIAAATPIAQQDAQTYATAAQQTAAAKNTAGLQDASLGTQTSQYNTGQTNASLSQAATASNTVAVTAQQIQGSKDIQELQGNVQKAIADLQANTTLSVQDKQSATQQALQAAQGSVQTQIAKIQSDTSLSIEQQQTQSQQLIAQWNNTNGQIVQGMVNAGNLANIQANGAINTQITKITNDNRLLLQSSQGASQIYSQSLANLSNILTSTNLSPDQKTTALNDQVQQLNDSLAIMAQIAGSPDVQSTLTFSQAA